MAVVILPSEPPASAMSIGMVSKSNSLEPSFAGADQELRRKGTRYALTFTMPSMDYVASMPWSTLQTEGITVVMEVYQPGLKIAPASAPRVKGAEQAGANLTIDGLTPGYIIKHGQFFSVIIDGQRFLYRADATVAADGTGEITVPLQTMLRRSPADGDVVEIMKPKIEGFVRDLDEVTVGVDHEVGLRFTVRERE